VPIRPRGRSSAPSGLRTSCRYSENTAL